MASGSWLTLVSLAAVSPLKRRSVARGDENGCEVTEANSCHANPELSRVTPYINTDSESESFPDYSAQKSSRRLSLKTPYLKSIDNGNQIKQNMSGGGNVGINKFIMPGVINRCE